MKYFKIVWYDVNKNKYTCYMYSESYERVKGTVEKCCPYMHNVTIEEVK